MNKRFYVENMGQEWYDQLDFYLESNEMARIFNELIEIGKSKYIYPAPENIFKAFQLCKPDDLKVVWLGMDPYKNPNEAIGVSFGINPEVVNIPFSLRAIHKELEEDKNLMIVNFDYSLTNWAKQGFLMLNVALTVEKGQSGSHIEIWEPFTAYLLRYLNASKQNVIYVLLGKEAQKYKRYLTSGKNHIIEAPHPAAEAYSGGKAGFYGSKIFSQIDEKYKELYNKEVVWKID